MVWPPKSQIRWSYHLFRFEWRKSPMLSMSGRSVWQPKMIHLCDCGLRFYDISQTSRHAILFQKVLSSSEMSRVLMSQCDPTCNGIYIQYRVLKSGQKNPPNPCNLSMTWFDYLMLFGCSCRKEQLSVNGFRDWFLCLHLLGDDLDPEWWVVFFWMGLRLQLKDWNHQPLQDMYVG